MLQRRLTPRFVGAGTLAALLSACSEAAPPDVDPALLTLCRDDLGISDADCERVAALALPSTLPPSAGNCVADDEAAAELGFRLFYDAGASPRAEMQCARCHLPEEDFGDGLPVPAALAGVAGARNSPSLLTAAWMGPYFLWDGRADSLWSQPLFAIENPNEMASSRLALAHFVFASPFHRPRYESVFGAMPPLDDFTRFPAEGKPGDASYDGMPAEDRSAIDRVAANVGKALEAYLRRIATGRSALDDYLAGDRDALGQEERSGLRVFVERGCIDCHSGFALSDGRFHRVEISEGGDAGRASGIPVLLASPFSSRGAFFDPCGPAPELPAAASPEDEGAFRTPSLRNVSASGPYGHAGEHATLGDLLAVHGGPLTAGEINDVWLFLMALEGAYPERPWSNWPAL